MSSRNKLTFSKLFRIFGFVQLQTIDIHTVPVKSLDTPTYSRVFLYFYYLLQGRIIVKTSKLWNNTWNQVVTKKVLNKTKNTLNLRKFHAIRALYNTVCFLEFILDLGTMCHVLTLVPLFFLCFSMVRKWVGVGSLCSFFHDLGVLCLAWYGSQSEAAVNRSPCFVYSPYRTVSFSSLLLNCFVSVFDCSIKSIWTLTTLRIGPPLLPPPTMAVTLWKDPRWNVSWDKCVCQSCV